MNDVDALIAAIQSHAWPLVAGLVLVMLVSLGRHPLAAPQWARIPALYRPLVPLALGLLSGVGEALVAGRPWLAALLSGVVAGAPALLAALPSQVVTPAVTVAPDPAGDPQHVTITRGP